MSGIIGILHRDGKPVDPDLLSAMTAALAYRGPDEQQNWVRGNIGFGHAMLCTTWESKREHQPMTLDGRAWLVGDARIDGRAALIDELNSDCVTQLKEQPDAELILRAYTRWGERCIEHLIGDFAFAIWDEGKQQLFCARDHMGIKPFYFAEAGTVFVFSNDLDCLRRYPGLSLELNEQALAHFVLFGHNREADTTMFAAIRRLPPAHTLLVRSGEMTVSRFWSLPLDGCVRYKRNEEYVLHFRALLSEAVRDRLRANHVTVFMSGGLDSTSVAALAVGDTANCGTRIKAFTTIEELVAPDEERHYSLLAAQYLNIDQQFHPIDRYRPFERFYEPELSTPEPAANPFAAASFDCDREAAQFGRIALTGVGGDPLLLATYRPLEQWPISEFIKTFATLALAHRRIPRLGFRSAARRWLGSEGSDNLLGFPEWFREPVDDQYDLGRHCRDRNSDASEHVLRPSAFNALVDPLWPTYFEADSPIVGRNTLEMRYPFFDVRLLSYVIALPPLPWFVEKHILRRAVKGLLPTAVRLRPKTVVQHSAVEGRRSEIDHLLRSFLPSSRLARWVDWEKMMRSFPRSAEMEYWTALRLISLDKWLSLH